MALARLLNQLPSSSTHGKSLIFWLSRVMKAAGFPVLASSDGTTKDTSGVAANDKWGGNVNPLADVYNASWDTAPIWIVHQGMSMARLTIGGPPSAGPNNLGPTIPDFLPGEPVTQTVTNAKGEWRGYTYDSVAATGHAAVIPRNGTVFDGTHAITGDWTGATITPTAYALFQEQIVIANAGNITSGWIATQMCATVAESASLFSTLASSAAGCTATVAPGLGGAGNGFPALAFSTHGDWNTPTAAVWWGLSAGIGRLSCEVKDNVGTQYITPDGTIIATVGNGANGADKMQIILRMFVDACEPGELYPVAWFNYQTLSYNSANVRLICTPNNNLGMNAICTASIASANWRGWKKRGIIGGSGDAFVTYQVPAKCDASNNFVGAQNVAVTERVNVSYAATPPRRRHEVEFLLSDTSIKGTKGKARWMRFEQNLTGYQSMDSLTWLCCASQSTQGSAIVAIGDGATTIVQS